MMLPSIFGESLFDDWFDDWNEFDRMNQLMRQDEKKLYGRHGKNLMKTDVKETKDGYEIDVDLPGFKKEDVQLQLENGYLNIQASKSIEDDKKDKDGEKYIRRERYSGSCSRSFYVGNQVSQDDIKAEFKHGVLRINLPKQEAIQNHGYIAIEG